MKSSYKDKKDSHYLNGRGPFVVSKRLSGNDIERSQKKLEEIQKGVKKNCKVYWDQLSLMALHPSIDSDGTKESGLFSKNHLVCGKRYISNTDYVLFPFDNTDGKQRVFNDQYLVYEGSMKDDQRSGYGRSFYKDTTNQVILYEGMWKSNVFHGPGRYFFRDGSFIEGEWEHGFIRDDTSYSKGMLAFLKKNPECASIAKNHDYRYIQIHKSLPGCLHPVLVYCGFVDFQYRRVLGEEYTHLVVSTLSYIGQFDAAEHYSGYGKKYREGELLFDGTFSHGQYEYGMQYWHKTPLYEGPFKNNLFSGVGVLYYPYKGRKAIGHFDQGVLNGFCVMFDRLDAVKCNCNADLSSLSVIPDGAIIYVGNIRDGFYPPKKEMGSHHKRFMYVSTNCKAIDSDHLNEVEAIFNRIGRRSSMKHSGNPV